MVRNLFKYLQPPTLPSTFPRYKANVVSAIAYLRRRGFMILKTEDRVSCLLEVVSQLAEGAEEADNQHVDVGQLDQQDHQDGAAPSEGKVDGLDDGESVLVEAKLCLEEQEADVAVGGVGDGVCAEDEDEEADGKSAVTCPLPQQTRGETVQESLEFGPASLLFLLFLLFICSTMRNYILHDKKCVKYAKGNYGSGEGEEPKEAATLKNEVAPVQSDGGEEGGDGVDDDEADGGGPG